MADEMLLFLFPRSNRLTNSMSNCGTGAKRTLKENIIRKKVSIQSLWEEEQAELLALPEVPYDVFRYEALKVSKTGFAAIETNRYGLSPELHGEIIQAKIFCDKIEFYHDHSMIASYRRSYRKNEELMDWTQYVRTLCRKPGAAEYTLL